MSTTPKQHIAKMIDAMVKGNDAEVEANFKSALVPKTASYFGLTSDEAPPELDDPEVTDPEVTEED